MPRWQSFMSFEPPRCRPLHSKERPPPGCKPSCLPPSAHWPTSPPPLDSWLPHPTHPGIRPPSPPLSENWLPDVPPTWSWPPSPPSTEISLPHSPFSKSWTPGPPPFGNWPPCPPPHLGRCPPCPLPPPGHWPSGPPPLGIWSQCPPPMGSWPADPSSLESWPPRPPYSGSWQLCPPSIGSTLPSSPTPGSWLPCPPPPENSLHGAPTPSPMPSGSSSGPACHDFMPSGCSLGSIPLIRPPETIQPTPKLDEKSKPSTKPGSNDKTKLYDLEKVKSTSKSGDSSNSGKQPANTDPPELTLNLDDKAKSLKHGSNDGTKRDAFDEVKPPTKSRDYSNLGTPLANTSPLNNVQKPDVQENLSTTPDENVKTEYPSKHGVSFEVKPPTTLGDSSYSGTSSASTNPLEPEPNLEDKGKTSINHDETKYPAKRDGFDEVKPISKPGSSSTSGMPAANIDISKLASNLNDKEKIAVELGGNDETKLGGSDEVKPPTITGGYDNFGMLPNNTDPSKLAPKPHDKENSLTILDGIDKTKSSTMHGGSSELKSPTNIGSKDETKPPPRLGGSDEKKPLHWFLIRKSTQGKQ
ncbi:hypothetical protein Rs2_16265 [Raphanus sativus]|nr:hypothetical protein Rs2_16265 [Raphanus sativus]